MVRNSRVWGLAALGVSALLLIGCAQNNTGGSQHITGNLRHVPKVRTTAYTHTERGGSKNAVGKRLSNQRVMSAASDWSRYPLGTHFRIVGTNEEYIIDDYGLALVGTNTIDLYKPTRLQMRRWGVRHVDIDILKWGSEEESLKVLGPRKKHPYVRRMIAALEKKRGKTVAQVGKRNSL